jgi:alpha-beta hydrolase superfamily lysophospholipase
VRVWAHPDPERIVVIAHGYGEHIGRYEHVAAVLVERGSGVCGPDHLGHGESAGERVLIADFEHVVDDLQAVVEVARQRPGGRGVAGGARDAQRPDRPGPPLP